jgi:quinol monooxygenase YgiN
VIIVMGHIRVRPADAERLARRLIEHEVATRALDGCLHYAISHDASEPGRLWVNERWRDKAAQASHLVGDQMVAFNRLMMGSKMIEADVQMFDSVGPGEWLLRAAG